MLFSRLVYVEAGGCKLVDDCFHVHDDRMMDMALKFMLKKAVRP